MRAPSKKRKKIFFITTTVIVWLLPISIYLGLFLIFEDAPLFEALAVNQSVNVSVTVVPDDPVALITPVAVAEQPDHSPAPAYTVKVVTPYQTADADSAASTSSLAAPISSFYGTALYPVSTVVLELSPDSYFVTLAADEHGRWTWTNYALPLSEGDQTIFVQTIPPADTVAAGTVYVERHVVTVTDADAAEPPIVELGDDTITDPGNIQINEQRVFGTSERSPLLFTMVLAGDNSIYVPGQTLEADYMIDPMLTDETEEATLSHTLYALYDTSNKSELVASYPAETIETDTVLEKKFELSRQATAGTYMLEATLISNGETYVQDTIFQIKPNIVGALAHSDNFDFDLRRTVLWNILIVVTVLNIILTFIAFEFNRLITTPPVDESDMRRDGYF